MTCYLVIYFLQWPRSLFGWDDPDFVWMCIRSLQLSGLQIIVHDRRSSNKIFRYHNSTAHIFKKIKFLNNKDLLRAC